MAAVGRHHQVGGEHLSAEIDLVVRRAGAQPDTRDAGAAVRPADQTCDIDPLPDADVRQRGDAPADAPVDQVAGAGEHRQVAGNSEVPTGGGQPGEVAGKVHEFRAGPHQLSGEARKEPLYDSTAAFQQHMRVPALRQPLPSGRRF